jgi:hypothetical protein
MTVKKGIQVGGFLPNADKTPDGTQQPVIMQQITVRPVNRQPQDITKWRNAHKSAEASIPRRVLLYDLYADVMLDAHVIAVCDKRIEAVTNAKWQFVDKDGEPVEAINDMIDSIGFEELIKEIILSKLWGYTMAEFTFFKDFEGKPQFSIYSIPRKHIRPDTGIVTLEQTGDTGINVREGIYADTILEVGKAKDLGLLLSAAQYAIFKDGGFSDYAQFVQTFGMPLLDATWDGFDENQRIQLNEQLDGLGSGGSIVRPAGTDIKLLEVTKNGDGKLQGNFIDALNREISKVILGNTETTESSESSGYAQAETHAKGEGKKNESDITFARRILNSYVVRIFKENGIDPKGGKFITQANEQQLSKKDAYDIHKSMIKDLNMPVSDDFMYKNYSLEKPIDYDAQKAAKEAGNEDLEGNTDPEKPDNPALTPPSKSGKKVEKPNAENDKPGKKPGKLKKLFLEYTHFFGSPRK